MSNTKLDLTKSTDSIEILTKITNLSEIKGASPSSMITLVIPPKYCI